MLTTLPLFLALSASAGTDCPVTTAELDVHLLGAMAAYEEQRYLDFELERRSAEQAMDCLSEVLRDQVLVNVHLVWTERALLDGDPQALLAGLRALRVVAPGFTLPHSWKLGSGSVEAVFLEATSLGPGREVRLPGRLVVDGHVAASYVPAERSAVVQIRNAEGSWASWYLEPSAPTATWMMARAARDPAPPDAVAPVPVPVED